MTWQILGSEETHPFDARIFRKLQVSKIGETQSQQTKPQWKVRCEKFSTYLKYTMSYHLKTLL
jgi:hypothetical protein